MPLNGRRLERSLCEHCYFVVFLDPGLAKNIPQKYTSLGRLMSTKSLTTWELTPLPKI
jgi:hypothetical protein